ncbi:MAG: hypothetical protein ACXWA9_01000 [Acidimicrobiia bacterium]
MPGDAGGLLDDPRLEARDVGRVRIVLDDEVRRNASLLGIPRG